MTSSNFPYSDSDSDQPEDIEAFNDIASFIEEELDFATSHYNVGYLKRRVRSRMRRTRCETYRDYYQYLKTHDDEQDEILNALSINVTGFFRNPEVWDEIRTVLRKLTDRTDDTIRVWSAACADGREPYSVALLALSDSQIDADRVSILATDINENALEKGRKGVYQKTTTQDIDTQLSYLNTYDPFTRREGDTFTLTAPVREMVTFEQHDLIHGEEKAGFDLVLCRNLMIYIERKYETPLFNTLCNAMNDDAYLVIGKAETLPGTIMDRFEEVDNRLRVYRLK